MFTGLTYSTYQQNLDALVNPYGNPGVSFYGSSGNPLKSNTSLIMPVHYAEANYGASGYGYGEFNLFTTNYNTWYSWFRSALHDDPDCVYQALYNYDSMYGQPTVEQAMLDAMALYVLPPPAILSSVAISDSNLNLVWLGGTNASCTLLSATNVTQALATWMPVATSLVGNNGLSTDNIPISTSELQRFYLLAIPYN